MAVSAPVERLGWLQALSLVIALGLLLIALADTAARGSAWWAYPLFWIGLLTMFTPVAARLSSSTPRRRERIALVVMLGLGLYIVKVLQSPNEFALMDESAHWRTIADIVRSDHLFRPNPLLPVSAVYPGLESVTSAVFSLSGLSLFGAAKVIAGAARLLMAPALFLLYEKASGSARIAGIATLLYMSNPGFLLFDSQFAYESLALSLAVVVLLAIARRTDAPAGGRLGWTLAALLVLAAVVFTHHLTSYALAAFLVLWASVAIVQRNRARQPGLGPGGPALLVVVAALSWLVYAASLTIGYLSPQLQGATLEVLRLIQGDEASRELFRSYNGQVAPIWERIVGFASVALLLTGLPFGVLQLWRRHRTSSLALALTAAALVYPASLAARLTSHGAEVSNRSSEFVFLALALVVAVGVVELGLSRQRDWNRRHLALVACVATVFAGGVIVGSPTWSRLPGPYLPAADTRSIDPQGIQAANWTMQCLGPGNRIISDRTNDTLMGTYGDQRPVTAYGDREAAYTVFFAASVGPAERAALQHGRIRYIVVDLRLSTGLPLVGVYYEVGEPGANQRTVPLDPALLKKFDDVPDLNRLFDSGDIVIYDARPLVGGPQAQGAC